jgi:hypothetical protein
MNKKIETNEFSPVLAVEYFSFGISHDGFICVAYKDERGTLDTFPLDVHDETDEKVLLILCKLADIHPIDLGLALAEQRRKFAELEGEA